MQERWMRQVTVMTGPERRRRWNDEQRLQILAEACAPGGCVADVARRHDISTARIYTWRRKLCQPVVRPDFAEAVVVDDNASVPSTSAPVIVLDLPGLGRASIFAGASPALAAATLKALR
jgi:transposase